MDDDSLIQTLNGILNGTNAATTKRQFIGDFTTFILNHIPYAQVEPKDLQTGLISFDGPKAAGIDDGKPVLVWHFGGLPYPIVKAAMIQYNYQRTWDGSGQTVHGAILFGFQSEDPQTLDAAPRGKFGLRTLGARETKGNTFLDLRDAFEALSNTVPTAVVFGTSKFGNLDTFVNHQLAEGLSATEKDGPFNIEFDGPARDNDSHHPFLYTLETLFNDQAKFAEIVWWYFGGRATRITKAIRIPLKPNDATSPSLFVGYSGPGTFP
jgi:hypothetical protein